MPIIIGIDPGLDGGLVVMNETGVILKKIVMPTVDLKKGRMVDFKALLFDIVMVEKPDLGVIEEVWAMGRGDRGGTQAAFKFGRAYQAILDAFMACQVRYELVRPQLWQKSLFGAVGKGQDSKAAALQYATRRWPMEDWRATERCKIAHNGLVDAACIGEYGRHNCL